MSARQLAVSFSLAGQTATSGTATIQDRSVLARLGRALVALLGLWLAATVCVFIPIAHFVLVPALALAGVVVALLRLADDVSLVSAEGICPRCKVSRAFGAIGRYRSGKTVHCSGCGCQIAVSAEPVPRSELESSRLTRS